MFLHTFSAQGALSERHRFIAGEHNGTRAVGWNVENANLFLQTQTYVD